jgi:hypothetical protein
MILVHLGKWWSFGVISIENMALVFVVFGGWGHILVGYDKGSGSGVLLDYGVNTISMN